MLRSIALWLEDRLHLVKLFESTAGHKVPPSTNSWFYVFGSGTLLCFVLQIVTGTLSRLRLRAFRRARPGPASNT